MKRPADPLRGLGRALKVPAHLKDAFRELWRRAGGGPGEVAITGRELAELVGRHRTQGSRYIRALAKLQWLRVDSVSRGLHGVLFYDCDVLNPALPPDHQARKRRRRWARGQRPLDFGDDACAAAEGLCTDAQPLSVDAQALCTDAQGPCTDAQPSPPHALPCAREPSVPSVPSAREDDDDDDDDCTKKRLSELSHEAIGARAKVAAEEMDRGTSGGLLRQFVVAALISFVLDDPDWLLLSARAARSANKSPVNYLRFCLRDRLPGRSWNRMNRLEYLVEARATTWLREHKARTAEAPT